MNPSQLIAKRSYSSPGESNIREQFFESFKTCPIPNNELLSNLGLFIKRQDLSKILFLNELYEKIIEIPGVIIEFGVRWGNNLALLESLRGIHEPFNHNRKIIGFDTFEGFTSVHGKDGTADIVKVGAYGVTDRYEEYLGKILAYHEQESPIPHIKKHELIKGDATVEVEKYFKTHPEMIVAFAYFDFDLYEPTKKCLEVIKDHITKGTVIGFDQINDHDFPGETLALKEVLGLDKYRLRKSVNSSVQSFLVVE
jgi:hypothetical protein